MKSKRSDQIFKSQFEKIARQTDRRFGYLLLAEFVAGVAIAFTISPKAWSGEMSGVYIHVWYALVLGGTITALPVFLAFKFPGRISTRYVITSAQMCFSILLIHLTGGRIESHFHVFASLAFIAFYREWLLLVPAMLIVCVDHAVRGVFWPESIYGVSSASPWRSVEHVAWVVFEGIFLMGSCIQSAKEMRSIADSRTALENNNLSIEFQVRHRTTQLETRQTLLEEEISERKRLEGELLHAQKMESIGLLAAGIAHEINTPIQYVGDNTRFVHASVRDLLGLMDLCNNLLASVKSESVTSGQIREIEEMIQEIDLEFIRTEVQAALDQTLDGVARVANLVRAMKDFSHPGNDAKTPTDLNRAIESTVTVCRNQWKYVATLKTEFDKNLPMVPCLAGEFNQVILNMIINAADAIADCKDKKRDGLGEIFIRTKQDGDWVEIRVKDTGIGIPESIRGKIFDPFFTTKEVGKGTGQGLAICHDVIVKKHGGTIHVDAEGEAGTTFVLRMPITMPSHQHGQEAA